MQEKVQEQREILEHYKNAGANLSQKDPNLELREMIKAKEAEIAKFDALLSQQALKLGNQIIPTPPPFQSKKVAEISKAEKSDSSIPDFMQRPQFIVDRPSGPLIKPEQPSFGINIQKPLTESDDVFGNNFGQARPQFEQQIMAQNQNHEVKNPFLTLNNQQNMQNTQFENERERRLRLREQERARRNAGGDEGIAYGANQALPPQPFKPQQEISNTNLFGENHQISRRDEMLAKKMRERISSLDRQDVPEIQRQQQPMQLQPSSYEPKNMSHLQQQIERIKATYMGVAEQQPEMMPPFNGGTSMVRQSSHQKLNFEQAKEIDHSINQKPNEEGGILKFGEQNDLNQIRRENEKRERQAEYQAFLDKQKRDRSPNQQIQRILSARLQQQQEAPSYNQLQVPQMNPVSAITQSPNRSHRNLVRANSFNRPQDEIPINIHGIPQTPFQMNNNNERGQLSSRGPPSGHHARSGSASRALPPATGAGNAASLIQGGYDQISYKDSKIMEQEEKLRKQREYKEYLDIQANKSSTASKPPTSLRPPNSSGSQQQQNSNFIAQSKSVRDEIYLAERRKQLGEEIFNQVLSSSRPGSSAGPKQFNQLPPIANPDFSREQNFEPNNFYQPVQMQHQQVLQINAQRLPSEPEGVNFFARNQENEINQKNMMVDKKKEYALELQRQMEQKKAGLPPKMPASNSQPSQHRTQNQFYPNQGGFSDEPQLPVHMSQDQRFQEILARKREEYKRQLDEQIQNRDNLNNVQSMPPLQSAQQQIQQQFLQPTPTFNHPSIFEPHQQPFNPGPRGASPAAGGSSQYGQFQGFSQPADADSRRQQQEEYRRELDAQRQMREEFKNQEQSRVVEQVGYKEKPSFEVIQHCLPQAPASGESAPTQQKGGGMKRSDITAEKGEMSEQEKQKRVAYQEELRIQMEQQKAKKEAEKLRKKREDEEQERQLQLERDKLEVIHHKELVKEGKRDPNAAYVKPPKQVNRSQFETSDVLENKPKQVTKQVIDDPPYKPFTLSTERDNFEMPPPRTSDPFLSRTPLDFAAPQFGKPAPPIEMGYASLLAQQQQQQLMSLQQPQMNVISQSHQDTPSAAHQKLLEDQQKMLQMYQQTLESLLQMQSKLIQEREMFHQQIKSQTTQFVQPALEISQYQKEIQKIHAVKDSLYSLMNNVNTQQKFTPIMNPNVQKNLNDFIKTQRDQYIRMSQSLSFKNRQYEPEFNNQIDELDQHNVYEVDEDTGKVPALDSSLNSNSKLVRFSNPGQKQFANKLKQKAEELANQEEHEQNRRTNTISPPQHADGRDTSPYNKNNASGLYQTWKTGQSNNNFRSISPSKQATGPFQIHNQNLMQASLAGSSQLHYAQGNEFTPMSNQDRAISYHAGVSPYPFNRPPTNIVKETIQELPEREHGFDTNEYDQEEMKVNAQKLQQSEQVMKLQKMHRSIETDQDFNCRDDETSQYSKSVVGRKSKVSAFSKANTNQIEANLDFIAQQVNMGTNLPAHNRTPFSQASRRAGNAMSPSVNSGVTPMGQALQTGKSFYKPVSQLNNSNMNMTGMAGAPNPKMTGSSFYNATMAKTRIQEQNQQEELQRQLHKIFSDAPSGPKDTIEVSERDGGKDGDTTFNQTKEGQQYALPVDQSQDIEDMSDINIAQSVGQSLEVHHNAQHSSIVADQQYGWMTKGGAHVQSNGVINEQEFESKSRDESSAQEGGTSRSGTRSGLHQTTKQSEMVWDDPDMIPDVSGREESENGYTEHDFDNFEVRDESESQIQARKSQYGQPNSDMQAILPITSQKKPRGSWGKEPVVLNAYADDFDEQNNGVSGYDFNIAEDNDCESSASFHKSKRAILANLPMAPMQRRDQTQDNDRLGCNPDRAQNISGLRLDAHIMTSETAEPQTAHLVHEDKVLSQLKLCSPLQNTISDDEEREIRNKQIDAAYEARNSFYPQPTRFVKRETSDVHRPKHRPSYDAATYNPNFAEEEDYADGIDIHEKQSPQSRQRDALLERQIQDTPVVHDVEESIAENIGQQEEDPEEMDAEKFVQESLESKFSKIHDIFGCAKESVIESLAQASNLTSCRKQDRQQVKEAKQTPLPESKHLQMPSFDAQSQSQRPMSKKQLEIQELAMLIQAAQGSVNFAVENSQQLNFPITKRTARRKANQPAQHESVALSGPNNLPHIAQQIAEDNRDTDHIIDDLDKMIFNLERQQQETQKIQSKYSSAFGFGENAEDEILESMPHQRPEVVREEAAPTEASQVTHKNRARAQLSRDAQADCEESEARQTVNIDNLPVIRPGSNMKVTRPISSKSNSTRYELASGLRKRQEYEQFHDEEDEDEQKDRPETEQHVKTKAEIQYEDRDY